MSPTILGRWPCLVTVGCFVLSFGGPARDASGQSVLERTPNMSRGWVGDSGTLYFNFLHRFDASDAPLRKVRNFPTFHLALGLPSNTILGVNYSTNSAVVAQVPNEWEIWGRWEPLGQSRGAPLGLALQAGYNEAAQSFDSELSLVRTVGPLSLLGAGRALSDGYGEDEWRWAVAGGVNLRLGSFVALAGDVASLTERSGGEKIAWSAGLQLGVPYTPHSFSLHIGNNTSNTLQGASVGFDEVLIGFEFTIPITLSRYFGGGGPSETSEAGAPAAAVGPQAETVTVRLKDLEFRPSRIEITAGTTVVWVNDDQVAHTVTADDGSWNSGLIAAGAAWVSEFEEPGTYTFHCTPHPFMTGVVLVR